MLSKIVLYTKPSCSLCPRARLMIQRVLDNHGDSSVAFEQVDISTDEQLEEKYGYLLPVISVNGRIVSELKVDGRAIRQALG